MLSGVVLLIGPRGSATIAVLALLGSALSCSLITPLGGLSSESEIDSAVPDVASEFVVDSGLGEEETPEIEAQQDTLEAAEEEDAPQVTATQACEDRAIVLCGKVISCLGDYSIKMLYGTQAACESVNREDCLRKIQAIGSSDTPQKEEQCAADLAAGSCDELLAYRWPDSCVARPGQQPDGSGCWTGDQCTSAHCNVTPGYLCGFCAAPLLEGQMCQHNGQCGWPRQCIGVCSALAAKGETCSSVKPCAPTLFCNSVCKPAKALGEECNVFNDDCDTARGLFCSSTEGECRQMTLAQPGESCESAKMTQTRCIANATCTMLLGKEICLLLELGQPCELDGGLLPGPCRQPSGCFQGKCSMPNDSVCP